MSSKKLLRDQVAFAPPSVWEGQTVARLADAIPQLTGAGLLLVAGAGSGLTLIIITAIRSTSRPSSR
jgi:hypothetical protein